LGVRGRAPRIVHRLDLVIGNWPNDAYESGEYGRDDDRDGGEQNE
jgi:hypothetical protein